MTETETLFNGRYLRMKRRKGWEYAERTNPGGAVIIVAVTAENKILFVEQFRIPVDSLTIEMPAGLIGDEAGHDQEDVLDAARRELLEETGYAAQRIEYITAGPSSAGMSNEMMVFVRAHDLVRMHAGGGDATENIKVHEVPVAEAVAWLQRKAAEGYCVDPKFYAGLYFIEHADKFLPGSAPSPE